MNNNVKEKGMETEAGRLIIKKIEKCESKIRGLHALNIGGRLLTYALSCFSFYSLMSIIREKYYNDSLILTSGVTLFSLLATFIIGKVNSNTTDKIKEYKYEVDGLEDEILYSDKCQVKK